MPNLVLEIGAEEMPAIAIPGAVEQLATGLPSRLAEARLPARSVVAYGAPRRLIVLAEGVPDRQSDVTREARGPAHAVAYDASGAPTGAAIGFARKQGVAVEDLTAVDTPQGKYVAALVTETGKPAAEALGPVLLDAIRSLTFPKTMRWGDQPTRFVRPVRWIVALLGDQEVPLEFAGVSSGRRTRGHRYLAPTEIELATADDLLPALQRAFVMVDPAQRRAAITSQADTLAAAAGGRVPWDDELLDENVHLVEWPTCLLGSFAAEYLELPRPVLVTAMKKHQRFFPVEGPDGRLLPHFISVRNGGALHIDKVRAGNQAVLTARFADARHFYAHDRDVPLETMAGRLSRLIFQEKLGTMADKTRRLVRLVGPLAKSHGLSADEITQAERAALLCKADLTSEMVVELPSLQGVMGREYALAHGEAPSVADAIAEHYLPRSATGSLPTTRIGKLLAVADRIDTLVGYAGLGIMPTGSADPFGLRRAAQGVVQILAAEADVPSLAAMQVQAAQGYCEVNGLDFPLDPLCNSLKGLFDQRITAYLLDRHVRYDLVDAAIYGGLHYGTIVQSVVQRALALQSLSERDDFVGLVQAAARVANILGSTDCPLVPGKEAIHGEALSAVERAVAMIETTSRQVDAGAFEHPSEKGLFDAAARALPGVARAAAGSDFGAVYDALVPLRGPVDTFFDDVLVMAEDQGLRRNRLALLAFVDALYKSLADFRKVVVA